jgi:acyl-CoA thioester hydrolase
MHLRHSAYADFAAQARVTMLEQMGFGAKELKANKLGPILFREELLYLREIGLNDHVTVTCTMVKCRKDGSHWSFTQDIYRKDGVKAAVVNTDGAWIDTEVRKLVALPGPLMERFSAIPKAEDFKDE